MRVRLLFFAQCAEWAGKRALAVPLSGSTTVRRLVQSVEALEELRKHARTIQVGVNCVYAGWDTQVRDGDEIAFLPPVSGG